MTKVLTRRDTLAMLAATLTLAPLSARALVAGANAATFALQVSDLMSFDPDMRKDPAGGALFNLAFRIDAAATAIAMERLDDMQGRPLSEFTLNWISPTSAQYALTMCSAYVHQYECAFLSRDGGGRRYDEFGLVVESTQGSLRRIDARGAATTAYSVTPQGARWERRVA